ncbi:hypothetical protein IAU60_004870 [Kwoniella sp. DSM 27419]
MPPYHPLPRQLPTIVDAAEAPAQSSDATNADASSTGSFIDEHLKEIYIGLAVVAFVIIGVFIWLYTQNRLFFWPFRQKRCVRCTKGVPKVGKLDEDYFADEGEGAKPGKWVCKACQEDKEDELLEAEISNSDKGREDQVPQGDRKGSVGRVKDQGRGAQTRTRVEDRRRSDSRRSVVHAQRSPRARVDSESDEEEPRDSLSRIHSRDRRGRPSTSGSKKGRSKHRGSLAHVVVSLKAGADSSSGDEKRHARTAARRVSQHRKTKYETDSETESETDSSEEESSDEEKRRKPRSHARRR